MKISALTYANLCAAMIDGTMNCAELAEETGLHYVTVLEYTRYLHRAGAVHICRWDADTRGRHLVKIYKLGPGRNATRPKMTAAQRQARRRTKVNGARQALVQAGKGAWVQAANGRLRFEAIA
jgi:hypothetical protein